MPRTSLKLVAFTALALCFAASAAAAKASSNEPQQKIVYLEGVSSLCLLGDECPDPRRELDDFGQKKGQPQVLPSLLSQGWRVVSIFPVNAETAYRANPSDIALLGR
jgi:hypothetical protein